MGQAGVVRRGNPHVALAGDALVLADGVTFVFGGDAIDRGPHGRRIIRTLLAARRTYGERVILLAGNRDLNKLRLVRELDDVPAAARGDRLRWIFEHTMGAPRAFDHRAPSSRATAARAMTPRSWELPRGSRRGRLTSARTSRSPARRTAPGRRCSSTAG